MNCSDRPRTTVDGSEHLEREIWSCLDQATSAIASHLRQGQLRTLVLIGGYGRGEGGVWMVDGCERPHNNLDLLVILNSGDSDAEKERLDAALDRVRASTSIAIDVGVTTVARLRRSPCLLMWFDMREAHIHLAGDAEFIPSLHYFSKENIAPFDVVDLLVNRGTLMVINDQVMRQFEGSEIPGHTARLIVKHTIKAIIGYGDAVLYAHGAYASSYRQKAKRIGQIATIPALFRTLYQQAVAFRLRPNYEALGNGDWRSFVDVARKQMQRVHQECLTDFHKKHRLPRLRWRHARELLLSLRNLSRSGHWAELDIPLGMKLSVAFGGPRAKLALAFPAVAYVDAGEQARQLSSRLLGSQSEAQAELQAIFLRQWGHHGDNNFERVAVAHRLQTRPCEG